MLLRDSCNYQAGVGEFKVNYYLLNFRVSASWKISFKPNICIREAPLGPIYESYPCRHRDQQSGFPVLQAQATYHDKKNFFTN
jgi:hypothetical protein